jgi:polyribonucleotide nucleotidyltransferase
MEFGAFVEILPGTDGLLHISQISTERIKRVEDVLKEGDELQVKVLEVDRAGKIRLSRKELLKDAEEKAGPARPPEGGTGTPRGEERRRGGTGPSGT